jgi:hypothetical protein
MLPSLSLQTIHYFNLFDPSLKLRPNKKQSKKPIFAEEEKLQF